MAFGGDVSGFDHPLYVQWDCGGLVQDQKDLYQEGSTGGLMSIFEVQNLGKNFGGLAAVKGVDFQVEEGEIFGLIGPNGSGKTTIFNLINNYYPLTSGDIRLYGQSIKGMKTYKICKLGIARTFQVVKPLARMTVLDNVTASAFCRVNTIKEAQKLALETIEFCGLVPYKDQQAKLCLSGCANGWRSPGPWPPSPNCCCWMKPRPDSLRKK